METNIVNENCGRISQSNNTLKLVLAWGLVSIPLVWGVLKTLQNALELFQ
jgi:hypothetical protein